MLTIECKMLGRSRPLGAGLVCPCPPASGAQGGQLTLRDLIIHVVHEEVRAFRERQRERRLIQTLTQAQIAAGSEKGKITMGASDLDQEVDTEDSAGAALQAFEDGLYFVFVDDEQQVALDGPVFLKAESRLTFLRLVALVGG